MNFTFSLGGIVYSVHTEVGTGTAMVVVEETDRPEPPMESSEE